MQGDTPNKNDDTPNRSDDNNSQRDDDVVGLQEVKEEVKSINESLYTLQREVEEISVKIAQMPLI